MNTSARFFLLPFYIFEQIFIVRRLSYIIPLLSVLFVASLKVQAQEPTSAIDWHTFTELNAEGHQNKKVIVFIYADWCKWCKQMNESVFPSQEISQLVNSNYYAIKLNGEKDQQIEFKGKTYNLKKEGENVFHEITEEFNKGNIAYPSIVILDENLKSIQALKGFRQITEMRNILNYFSENYYKKISWSNYVNSINN